jgi:hypothetical protein
MNPWRCHAGCRNGEALFLCSSMAAVNHPGGMAYAAIQLDASR